MEPTRLQKLFTRWAGLSPKAFLQAVTLDHARALLEQSATVLDTTYEVGLSGPGRLHDLFVTHEAVTPGSYRARGEGLVIRYGFHPSPFGKALVMATEYGLAGLAFADEGQESRGARRHDAAAGRRAEYVEDSAAPRRSRRASSIRALAAGDAAPRRADRHATSRSASGRRCSRCRSAAPRPIPTSPARSTGRTRRAPSARRSARTRSPSWCPAIACSAAPGSSPAITGG